MHDRHARPGTLSWHIYHGPRRDAETLESFDVIITTYKTVALEWQKHMQQITAQGLTLYSARWYRIVLDEGIMTAGIETIHLLRLNSSYNSESGHGPFKGLLRYRGNLSMDHYRHSNPEQTH